jgi:hypothetical protein
MYSVLDIIQCTATVNIAKSRIAAKCRRLSEMSHSHILRRKFGVFLEHPEFSRKHLNPGSSETFTTDAQIRASHTLNSTGV